MKKLSQLNIEATYSEDAAPGSVDLIIEINGIDLMRQTVSRDTLMAALAAVVDPLAQSAVNENARRPAPKYRWPLWPFPRSITPNGALRFSDDGVALKFPDDGRVTVDDMDEVTAFILANPGARRAE